MQKEEQVSFLAEKIRQADAVLIGGGSGLSSAAGYNHYHWLPYMEECLQDFKEWYGLKSPFDGFYYCYSSPEQQWAYYARYIQSMWDAPTGQPYYDLLHFTELSGRHSVLERPRSEMKRSFIPQSSFKSMARAKAGINAPLTGFQTVDYSNQAEQRIVLLMSIQ